MGTHQRDHAPQNAPWDRGVCIVRPEQFDSNTAQTPGMQRVAAVSQQLAGSQGIWAGVTTVAPHAATGKHHHGKLETVIYVQSGHIKMRWGDRLECEEEAGPGDFVYVPPFVPHMEINASDGPSVWIVVRNDQEPIVVNLEPVDASQQSSNDAIHGR